MAWADLQPASFRGIEFDCITISDSAARAVAQHAYPYRDGADIEDLGSGPRTIRVRAIFYGDDYLARLNDFVDALAVAGADEFIHPVFGSLRVQLTEQEVSHDADNIDQAGVTLTFIESEAAVAFFAGATETQDAAAIESAADDALEAATSVLAEQMGAITELANVPGFGDITLTELSLGNLDLSAIAGGIDLTRINDVRALMDGVPDLLAGLPGMPAVVLANFDAALNPRAWAGDLTALTSGLLDGKLDIGAIIPFDLSAIALPDFGSLGLPQLPSISIPGDFTGLRGVARQVAGFTGAIGGGVSALTSFGALPDAGRALVAGFRALADIFSLPVAVTAYAASAPLVGAGLPLTLTPPARQPAADAQVVATHAQTEFALTLAVAARRVLETEAKLVLLTPAEIESVASITRATLEITILAWRANYPVQVARPVIERLRNVALLTQASAQSLIARRPPIVTRTLTSPANTRLLAHRLYGDHRRAAELVRLNQYGRKPILDAGAAVQAYAQ